MRAWFLKVHCRQRAWYTWFSRWRTEQFDFHRQSFEKQRRSTIIFHPTHTGTLRFTTDAASPLESLRQCRTGDSWNRQNKHLNRKSFVIFTASEESLPENTMLVRALGFRQKLELYMTMKVKFQSRRQQVKDHIWILLTKCWRFLVELPDSYPGSFIQQDQPRNLTARIYLTWVANCNPNQK